MGKATKEAGQFVKVRRNFYDLKHPDGWDPSSRRTKMKSKRFRFEVFETDPDRAAKLAADGFVWLCDEDGNIDMSGTKTAGKAKYVPPVLEKDPRKTTHSALLKFAGTNDINLTDDERQLKKADLIALIDKRMTEKATAAGSEGLTRRMSDGTPKEEPKADETE